MARQICLAVGVGDSIPGKYLSGAVNDARRIHAWARSLGYAATLLTDADGPVAIDAVGAALHELLWPRAEGAEGEAPPPETDRLIVYFAGHGLLRDADEGIWLLSDSLKIRRAPGVDALRRALFRYPVKHVAIISDACLSLPDDMDWAEIRADGVLEMGPAPRREPWTDKFIATQEGTTTFMVPGDDPEDDRCIFSGVLLEGLWGLNEAAFSKRDPRLVTGNSLSSFLREEVHRVSGLYSTPREPGGGATFPEGKDVYFKKSDTLAKPALPPWPDPGKMVKEMGTGRPKPQARGRRTGLGFAPSGQPGGRRPVSISAGRENTAKKAAPSFPAMAAQLDGPTPDVTGFAALAGDVAAIWHDGDIKVRRAPGAFWAVQLKPDSEGRRHLPARILVEFADGPIVATIVSQDLFTKIARDRHGASAIVMPEIYGTDTAALAREAILEMEGGRLKVERASDLIVRLRQLKHTDPVLGVISAYLYDSLGDTESIRRMAYFYADRNEPIPYDIALLGMLHGRREGDELWVHVPPVAKRKPRSELEKQHDWTYMKTPQQQGLVGGDWPWLRQGWSFLEDPSEEESTLIVPELLAVLPHLSPGRFATVNRDGAEILGERFGLKRRPQ